MSIKAWGRVIGIDLGTVNSVVVSDRKVVLSEPTLVVYNDLTNQKFFGHEALPMAGSNAEGVRVVWPIVDGKVYDPEAIDDFMNFLMTKARTKFLGFDLRTTARIVVAISCELNSMYRNLVISTCGAYCNDIEVIEQPLAAALGEGYDLLTTAVLVVDVGGGTTDFIAIDLAGVVKGTSRSIPIAGNRLDKSIQRYIKRNFDVWVGLQYAQEIKHQIGCAKEPVDDSEKASAFVRFKSYNSQGKPTTVRLVPDDMPKALAVPLKHIAKFGRKWIADVVRRSPESLTVTEEGLTLQGQSVAQGKIEVLLTGGGGALLTRADDYFGEELSIPFRTAKDPLHAAAFGAEKAGKNEALLNRFKIRGIQYGDKESTRPMALPNKAPIPIRPDAPAVLVAQESKTA